MLVECYDEKGAEVYEMIIKQIFQDLVLGPAVEDLKAFANPDEAVFILAIKMKKTSGVIKFGDVANFTYDKNNNVTNIYSFLLFITWFTIVSQILNRLFLFIKNLPFPTIKTVYHKRKYLTTFYYNSVPLKNVPISSPSKILNIFSGLEP